MNDLEQRLDPKRFIRIHRATLVNTRWVKEIVSMFGGNIVIRLKDPKRTELAVARNRAHEVRTRLGI
jgi:two-component system LytT family response regulator